MTHPHETELALLAGGDCGRVAGFFLARHVRGCRECAAKVEGFEMLREDLAEMPAPDLDWSSLAAEMKANIRLGLEAGECVRLREPRRQWNPRLAVAFASLSFLICAGLIMRSPATLPAPVAGNSVVSPVLESTGNGIELRDGSSSITLLSHPGGTTDQTASAEGGLRARSIDGGAVTITNVSF
jgi:hypothetical protein